MASRLVRWAAAGLDLLDSSLLPKTELYGDPAHRQIECMPKSRSRPKRNAPLLAIQNIARGTRDPLQAIARARSAADLSVLPELSAWVEKIYRRVGLVGGVRPRKLASLQPSEFVEETTLLKELVWATSLFQRHADALKAYLQARNDVSAALLEGRLSDADVALSALTDEAGYSLFSIETGIALAQAMHGLDHQKEYVADIKSHGASHNVNFYSYWWSIRAESGSTAEDFISGVVARSAQWVVTPPHRALILFHLARIVPPEGEESNLLAGAISTSVIDYYEAVVSLAVAAVAEGRPSAALFVSFAVTASAFVDDPRLRKLCFLGGDLTALASLPVMSRDWWQASVGQAPPPSERGIANLEDVVASAICGAQPENLAQGLPSTIWTALRSLVGEAPHGDRYPTEIARVGLMFSGTTLGDFCLALRGEQWGQSAKISRADALKRFCAAPELSPYLVPHLESAQAAALTAAIESNWGVSPNTEWDEPVDTSLGESALNTRGRLEEALRSLDRQGDSNPSTAADPTACLHLAESLRKTGYHYRRGLMTEIEALLALGQLDEAAAIFCAAALDRSADPSGLPTEAVKTALTQEVLVEHAANIRMPIALDIVVKAGDSEVAPLRFYAAEDYMAAHGADRPTALDLSSLSTDPGALIYFLSEVCTPAILSLSVAFGTHAELQDERLAICRLLSKLDPEHAEKYEQEALGIVRARLVATALEDVQRTKIAMDEAALRQWASRTIRRDFERYSALLTSEVVVVNEKFREQLYAAVETGNVVEANLDIPENEASALLASMVHRFIHECALSQEHGIDSYLSVRIRHGTISGAVRGPVEAEHLVTRKAAGSRFYRKNEFWSGELAGQIDSFQADELNRNLSDFSRQIDERIASLVDESIQVVRPERPKGLFNLTLSKVSIFTLATDITPDTDFDDFVERCLEYFWLLVDESLVSVRAYIAGPFKEMIWSDFGDLETNLSTNLEGAALAHIRDAVLRSRTEMMHALARMAEWFTMPTPMAKLPLDLDMLVDLALTTLRNFYPDFAPKVVVKSEGLQPLTGVHGLFADVFFILFENIMLRSGNDRDPDVEVNASIDGSTLLIRVENCVRDSEDQFNSIESGVAEARRKIETGAYKSAVRREGGSGYPKLMKLLQISPDEDHFFFRLDRDEKKFVVQFPLRVLEISQ